LLFSIIKIIVTLSNGKGRKNGFGDKSHVEGQGYIADGDENGRTCFHRGHSTIEIRI